MGFRQWCIAHWTISYENLKYLCGPEVEAIESDEAFDRPDSFGDTVGWYGLASDEPVDAGLQSKLAQLQAKFMSVTGGLELMLVQYDEDMDGTRGQDVEPHEGVVFCVNNVVALTPAGAANVNLLSESSWIDAG